MKIKNISGKIQKVKNILTGWESLIGPTESMNITSYHTYNKKYFKIMKKGGVKNVQN